MPRRDPVPQTLEDTVAVNFEANLQKVEDRLVAKAGRPPDAKRLSEAEDDHLWALRDTSVDYDTLAQRLLSEGLPPEEVQQLAIVQEMPDLAAVYQQPTQDAEMAHMLAVFAEYPYRLKLLATLGPTEQVAKAKRLDARMQRASGEPVVSTITPAPASPVPMQPQAQPMPQMGGQTASAIPSQAPVTLGG